jgi:hypothetical protein
VTGFAGQKVFERSGYGLAEAELKARGGRRSVVAIKNPVPPLESGEKRQINLVR